MIGTRQNAEWGGSPLVSFDHVIDPHFVTFSSHLYTTIRNPNPNANPNTNPNPNHIPNPNPNSNLTVITNPQIGPMDQQIVTVQIRPAPHFVAFQSDLHYVYIPHCINMFSSVLCLWFCVLVIFV